MDERCNANTTYGVIQEYNSLVDVQRVYNDTRARTFGMKFGSKEWMTNVCYVNCDFNQDRGLNCAVTSPLLNVSTAASSPSFHVFFPSFLYPDFIGQHSLLLSIKFS